ASRYLEPIFKGILVADLVDVWGTQFLFNNMNTSQHFSSMMSKKSPFISNIHLYSPQKGFFVVVVLVLSFCGFMSTTYE
uniref:Uncharacterized protein n=1 Tax=Neovison vison TaxID=452646 RepID=A0A8C7ENW9_NEOVI